MSRKSLLHPATTRPGTADRSQPTMAMVMAMAGHSFSSGDAGRCLRAFETLQRTGTGFTGTDLGFSIKPEFATSVFDKARLLDGPCARVNWRTTRTREFYLPVYNESSRANGSRWGGAVSVMGASETKDMSSSASTPSLGRVNFNMCRMTVYSTPISRDLLADSSLVEPMLDFISKSEIRFLVDAALIGSSNTSVGNSTLAPEGILTAKSSIAVTRGTSSQIKAADIDALWSSIAGPNKRNAAWFASDEVIQTIDQTAQATGGWAESNYFPQGRNGNEYALLKGRPLIPCEACSALGTAGDLCVADFSDYDMFVHVDANGSTLGFNVTQPVDGGHQGAWGLPEGAVESRRSDHFLFSSDEVVYLWKARMDGHFRWNQSVKNVNGSLVGPCAALH